MIANLSAAIFAFALVLACTLGHASTPMITGTWFDICPCHVPCTCWKIKRSNVKICLNVHIFRIEQGEYKGVSIAGEQFVLLNKSLWEFEAPRSQILILNSNTRPERATVISDLISDYFGATPTTYAHISVSERPGFAELNVPNLLTFKITFDPDRKPTDDVGNFIYPWLSEPRQGLSQDFVYSPSDGDRVTYSGTNALSAKLKIPSAK